MAFFGQRLHQSVFPVPGIQAEGHPYGQRTGEGPEREADPLADTGHIEDDHHQKDRYKTAGKNEQVL